MRRSPLLRTTSIASVVGCLALTGTVFAQQSVTPPQPPGSSPQSPSAPPQTQTPSASFPSQMSSTLPSKSESASAAFEKLDASRTGYVNKDQVAKLTGFNFAQADKNSDDKVSRDEFQAAWESYSRP